MKKSIWTSSRLVASFVVISLTLGVGGSKPELKSWPSDQIEHDLPWNPEAGFKLMPLDEFEAEINRSIPEFGELPKLPSVRWRTQIKNWSLVPVQSPVKNQGMRGQCHNFATTAAMEYAFWAGEGKALNFSEQCNAWKFYKDCVFCCKNPASEDNDGGWAQREIYFIYDKFMKYEEDFPYSELDPRQCDSEYNDQPYFRFSKIQAYTAKLNQIKAAIDNRFVVVLSVAWREEGWNSYGEQEYLTSYPRCTSDTCGGHAVVIVGYDDHYFGQNKGGYIIKNSWSPSWGWENGQKPAGFGVIPYPYLKQFGRNYTAVSHEAISPINGPGTPGCKR